MFNPFAKCSVRCLRVTQEPCPKIGGRDSIRVVMARDMGGPRVPLVVVLIIHSFSHTASTEFSAHHIRISSATGTSGYAMDWRNAERFGSALRLRGG
eukprot:146811-Rhodomonas_salina.1